MRNFMLSALATCFLIATGQGLFAQNSNQQFPWKATQGKVPIYQSSTIGQPINSRLPPIIRSRQPVQSILQQDDKVPAPQGNTAAPAAQEPALSVQSNAIAGDPYANRTTTNDIGPPRNLLGSPLGLEIGGWGQAGYHDQNNGLWNNRKNDFTVQQFWLHVGKKATAQNRIGYRIDAAYGLDAQNFQAFGNPPDGNPSGWDNSWDNGAFGWALPQAYLEFNTGDTTIRAGKFLSPFGCEKVPSVENFFYSRSFTRVMTEPFTMSGIVAERSYGNNSSLLFGATAGWDTAFDGNSGFNVLTGFTTQLNPNVSIKATSSLGDTGRRGSGTLHSIVTNVKMTEKVDYALQTDMVNLNLNSNDEFGIIHYLTYHRSDRLAFGARLEWWKSDQIFVDTKSTWSFTTGTNFRPTTNIMIRPELRFDWGAAAVDPGQAIMGIDAIFVF